MQLLRVNGRRYTRMRRLLLLRQLRDRPRERIGFLSVHRPVLQLVVPQLPEPLSAASAVFSPAELKLLERLLLATAVATGHRWSQSRRRLQRHLYMYVSMHLDSDLTHGEFHLLVICGYILTRLLLVTATSSLPASTCRVSTQHAI